MTRPGPLARRQFASDNYSGICPEAWEAMAEANHGHAPGYGDDAWTARATVLLRELFEVECKVFFTFNGTSANALSLAAMCQSYHSIVCHQLAHVETDECGAPEFFSNGTKLLPISGKYGRVESEAVAETVLRRTDIHYPKPRVLSVTQSTEMGTVYTLPQLQELHEVTRRHELRFHMDGARFANAIASLKIPPKEITWKAGIDVLCFGGTKNGMAVGEAIVFFKRDLAREFAYRCKQAGQLASKMRFLAAPWVGLLQTGAWLKNAERANQAAARLEAGLLTIPGVEFLAPREANACFVSLPAETCETLRGRGWRFYTFIGVGGCRLMTSWDTSDADVDALLADIRELQLARQSA
jgi:threonine aldolase